MTSLPSTGLIPDNFFYDLYKNFNDRNIDPVIAKMTDNVQWANGMEGGYVHGHAGVKDYWTRQFAMINAKVTPVKIEREGNRFIIQVHQVVHDLEGKLLMGGMVTHIFTLEKDKISLFNIGKDE